MLSPERHSLVLHHADTQPRGRTVAWVADALARGDKVLHRAADAAALLDALGPAGWSAHVSGQLQIVDPGRCHVETGGSHRAVRELHEDLIRAAFDGGFPGVVLTADMGALDTMLPEPGEQLAHEHDLERLTTMPGVRALCTHNLLTEQSDLLAAVAGLHYRSVDDVLWSAHLSGDRLLVRGEIDADNAGRFGSVLRAAAAHGVQAVDLADVTLLSAAGARAFDDAVDLLRRQGRQLRLVNTSPTVHRALRLLRLEDDDGVAVVAGPAAVRTPAPEDVGSDSRLGGIARELTKLTGALLEGPTVATVLRRITETALQLVPHADLASITLRSPDGAFHTPIHTAAVALELDQLQYDLNEGPCLDAARVAGNAIAVSEDLATEPAWPRFGPAAARHGLRAVLSVALLPDVRPPRLSGALNLYSRRAGRVCDTDVDIALILASHASLALATTEATTLQDLQVTQLRKAVDSRDVIGQAKGILMQRRGISADEAFELLRGLSQDMNVKVTELARTLATRHTELDLPAKIDVRGRDGRGGQRAGGDVVW